MRTQILILASFVIGVANADDSATRLLTVSQTNDGYLSARTHLINDADLSDVQLQAALMNDQWEIRQQAAVIDLWRRAPERAQHSWLAEPGLTRLGTPRFAGELWRGPDAAPLLLERYLHADEVAENRAALIAALRHTEGDWSQALSELFIHESDAYVREVMTDVSRHADPHYAWTVIEAAAHDDEPDIRSAALRSIASRTDGQTGRQIVEQGLRDGDSTVRSSAARTAGVLELQGVWTDLRNLLTDQNPDVRLNALRALSRINEANASILPEIDTLREDPESRVRRLAERMTQP